MLKDTKSLGNNKAPACESRGFVLKKKVCFLTHLLFVSLSTPPKIKVRRPKRGKFSNKDMDKIQNISEIHPTLGFTEFDIIEKYCKGFHERVSLKALFCVSV
jgi:hypothetical protein